MQEKNDNQVIQMHAHKLEAQVILRTHQRAQDSRRRIQSTQDTVQRDTSMSGRDKANDKHYDSINTC